MDTAGNKLLRKAFPGGSALILAVVLTSLLAIVGVLFVMVARVDKMATSSISENRELNFAIETVIAMLSQELVLDVPGMAGQEYYDYPDVNDAWLASLQPVVDVNGTPFDPSDDLYIWPHITDLYGNNFGMPQYPPNYYDPDDRNNLAQWDSTRPVISDKYIISPYRVVTRVVADYEVMGYTIRDRGDWNVNADLCLIGARADADGDGIADSRWVILPDLNSSKGKPIYAAVRVIDNGAMLNVNTAYKFDPNNFVVIQDDPNQMLRINLIALAGRPGDPATLEEQGDDLLRARANNGVNVDPYDLEAYSKNVIWRYNEQDSRYTPFDISDELELRYRFLVNHPGIDTRLETLGMEQGRVWEFRTNYDFRSPAEAGEITEWFKSTYAHNGVGLDPNYAYRHIATTYNMDRIINPSGATFNNGSMVNVNKADENLLFAAIRAGLPEVVPGYAITDANALAAQLAVNMVDLRDIDAEVTTRQVDPDSKTYYGFEAQPFISEIGFRISESRADYSANNYFAIELYNPFYAEIPLGDFELEFHWQSGAVSKIESEKLAGYVISDESRFVITNNPDASGRFGVADLIRYGGGKEDPRLELAKYRLLDPERKTYELSDWCENIYLIRHTSAQDIYLDRQPTQKNWFPSVIDQDTEYIYFYCRPENDWNIVYQDMVPSSGTLGQPNGVTGDKRNYNFPFSLLYDKFITVGDIARALIVGPSEDPNDTIGWRLRGEPNEQEIRLDLTNPAFAGIFQYLTVIDPVNDFIDNDGDGLGIDTNDNKILDANEIDEDELKVPGRININTAPWFVIAQLPWMMPQIAQAIVTHRDTTSGAFESISELMQVPEMGYYAYDANDLEKYPDLTPNDGAANDFEERDVIFSRISNLATVRSDVFTAYILVRIGIDGPQKRYIAIFDRSLVRSPSDKVRILALHPVPDPR